MNDYLVDFIAKELDHALGQDDMEELVMVKADAAYDMLLDLAVKEYEDDFVVICGKHGNFKPHTVAEPPQVRCQEKRKEKNTFKQLGFKEDAYSNPKCWEKLGESCHDYRQYNAGRSSGKSCKERRYEEAGKPIDNITMQEAMAIVEAEIRKDKRDELYNLHYEISNEIASAYAKMREIQYLIYDLEFERSEINDRIKSL